MSVEERLIAAIEASESHVTASLLSRSTSALERVPLQRLAISPAGSLSQLRVRTCRPIPSIDKENIEALTQALDHRQVTAVQRIIQLSDRARRSRSRLVTNINRIIDETIRANSPSAARPADHPRLSMPLLDSDDVSEPDLSVLGMTRPGPVSQHFPEPSYDDIDDEILSQDQYEAEDTSVEDEHDLDDDDDDENDVDDDDEDHDQDHDDDHDMAPLIDPATAGLKEISNLGKFTVSSHKPGNGVEELRSDDLKRFWQSDGPQPHRVTVYFVKRVGIRDIRFFVDYTEDESYTPTKIVFKSGTSENNLIEFASMTLESPVGWQQVPIAGAGGDPDGNTLVSYVLQMQILENHQNGKDTHLRGIKIYAFDSESSRGVGREHNPIDEVVDLIENPINRKALEVRGKPNVRPRRYEPGEGGLTVTDLMREPEIR